MPSEENETSQMIDEMLSDYEPDTEPDAEPEGDVEEETPEEFEGEESVEEETSDDEPEDSEPVDDEPGEELSEVDRLKQQVEKLQDIINQSQFQSQPTTDTTDQSPSTAPPDFFGEWQYEDIIENETDFKKFLGEFAEKIKTWTQNEISSTLPDKVSSQVLSQVSVQEKVKTFYEQNKPLAKVRPFVAQITGQVSKEHPDWNTDKVLIETAKRAYDALGLDPEEVRDGVKQDKQTKRKKPAFASTKGGAKKPKPAKTELEEQLEELMDV